MANPSSKENRRHLAREAAQLRATNLSKHAPFAANPASIATIEKMYAAHLRAGEIAVHRSPQGALDGFLLTWFDAESFFGLPVHFAIAEASADPSAQSWLAETLMSWERGVDAPALLSSEPTNDLDTSAMRSSTEGAPAHLQVVVPPWCQASITALSNIGVKISSVHTVGSVETALRRLKPPRPTENWPRGTCVRVLEPADVDEVIRLWQATFAAEPEWCWFGANPGYLATLRKDLTAGCTQTAGRSAHRSVVQVGASIEGVLEWTSKDEPGWGPHAGVGLVLSPALRGRGLLRGIYHRMLGAMASEGVQLITGSTSQPPVMKLSAEMGRVPLVVRMRRWDGFPPGHFAPLGIIEK